MVDVSNVFGLIQNYVMSHPTLATMAALVWPVSGMVVNLLLYLHPLPVWEQDLEQHPRYAAFAKFVRSVGIDPVQVMQALATFILGRASSVKK